MNLIRILVGIVLLTLGRRIFWLFVAAIGFVVGLNLSAQFLGGQPEWVALVIALVAGLIGALLAIFIQQLGVAVAGFLGGGYIAITLLDLLGVQAGGGMAWLPFIIGGIIGLVLAVALFDWALIILSSLVGASLIVQAAQLGPLITALLFIGLILVGVSIQANLIRDRRPRPARPSKE